MLVVCGLHIFVVLRARWFHSFRTFGLVQFNLRLGCWTLSFFFLLLLHIYRCLELISIMFHINCLCFSQRACNFLDKMHHRLQTKLWWLKHSRLPFDAIDAKKLKRERIFSFFRSSQQILLLFFASCALYFYQAVATYTFFSSLVRSALALKTVHNSSYKRIHMCVFRLCIICIVFCTVEMSSMFRHFSRLAFDYIFFFSLFRLFSIHISFSSIF